MDFSNIHRRGPHSLLEMPYHKKRKTDKPPRAIVDEFTMKLAVTEVINRSGVNTIAKERGIDRMTLKRYVRKTKQNPQTICKPNYVTKQVFTNEEEKSL